MIAEIVYVLCGLTSILCAGLLYRRFRLSRARLLFWSTACFVCLAVSNVLLYIDLVTLPNVDLAVLRNSITLCGLLMLLWGMIRERS